jgi:hypothetical protein
MAPSLLYVKSVRRGGWVYIRPRVTIGSTTLAQGEAFRLFPLEQRRLVRRYNRDGRGVSIRFPTADQLKAITTRRGLLALAIAYTRPIP